MGDDDARTRAARLSDVAGRAGVDPSLVSRVLSGNLPFSIRAETRQRILDAARELEYVPNAHARALRRRRSMVVGMVVPTLTNVVYERIHAGASERAELLDYSVLVAAGSAESHVERLLGQVDGLLLAVATGDPVPLARIRAYRMPVVLVNRGAEGVGIPSVTVDDADGAAVATRHLLALGHREIAHVAGPAGVDTARRRLEGFLAALAGAGVAAAPELVVDGGYSEAGGFAAAEALLARRPRPTALFVANVRAAIGALAAIRRAGLDVPGDVSVASLHDAPLAEYLDPPLTTVRMPLEEMGRRAVDLVLSPDLDEADSVRVDAPPVLIERGSTAPPAAARPG